MTQQVVQEATLSTMTLLVLANSALTIVAGYFLREFVADVRKLTERVAELDKRIAVLAAVVNREIDHFAKDDQQ